MTQNMRFYTVNQPRHRIAGYCAEMPLSPSFWKGVFMLVDRYQRRFNYLRLSLTELCNFKCIYCLPDGTNQHRPDRFLSLSEIDHILALFTELGIQKVRLTGGEPTLRRDFVDILSLVADYAQIKVLAITTNGSRLLKDAARWQQAGMNAINISVDSLSPYYFRQITGNDKLHEIMQGIDLCLSLNLQRVKVNTVLMKGMNDCLDDYLTWIKDRPIELRFIELMETGQGVAIFDRHWLSGHVIEQQLLRKGWQSEMRTALSGPAKVYTHPDYLGKIGLIMPYSKDFCRGCNRVRVSATGKFHYCLFGESAVDLRPFLSDLQDKETAKAMILSTLKIKPETHLLHQHQSGLTKNLAMIGG